MPSLEYLPLCDILITSSELKLNSKLIQTIILFLIEGDCWAITVTKNGAQIAKKNSYVGYDSRSIANDHYLSEEKWLSDIRSDPILLLEELVDINNYVDIYLFDDDSWKVRISKTKTSFKIDCYSQGPQNNFLS